MKTQQSAVARSICSCLVGLSIVAAAPDSWAQDAQEPARISVRLVDVKSEAVPAFEAAIAEIAKASEAAGRPFFHVYQAVRGPDLPSFAIFTMDAAYNELPPFELPAGLVDRIQDTVNGSRLMTQEIYPELGIDSGSVKPSGEFLQVRVRTTTPSGRQAFFDWHMKELTPALRTAGLTDLRSGRVIVGGNTNTFVRYSFSDRPIIGGIPVENAARLFGREADLTTGSEDYVYRYREDLSTTAEQQ